MSETTTTTVVTSPVLTLLPQAQNQNGTENSDKEYKYTHLLPVFSSQKYLPLEPFEHIDPGHRALSHSDPRAFLGNATRITEIQPVLGSEIEGVQLTELDNDGRDQLALYVRINK